MPEKEIYQVWLGYSLLLSTADKTLALKTYLEMPSGKGLAPSKRRELIKCKILKSDNNEL